MLPLYAAARILIPEWLKSQISSNLPPGSSVKFGEIKTNNLMGVKISSLVFTDNLNAYSIVIDNLNVLPNFSTVEPAIFTSSNLEIISNQNKVVFTKLKGTISFNSNYKKENLILSGDFKQVTSEDKIIANNINFILEGIFSNKKNINVIADNMLIDYQSPMGKINIKGHNLVLDTKIRNTFISDLALDNFKLDLSNLGSGNLDRIINGEELTGKVELNKDGNWVMPIEFISKNLSSPQVSNIDLLSFNAKGEWPNSKANCTWHELFFNEVSCGRMINVRELFVSLMDNNNKLIIEGDGLCVAPQSGCPQNINSNIYSKGTSPVFSKIMMTGIINPIVGGILLASLLSSPNLTNENIEHQVQLEILGSQILVNGKKIF